MKNRNSYFICFLFLLLLAHILTGQESQDLLQQQFKEKLDYKQMVYQQTLDFIESHPDHSNLAELYFNLAELSAEINVFQPSQTARFYEKVLELEPDHLQKDVFLYNIAFYQYKTVINQRDAARLDNLDLVMNWPDSLRLSEEQLRPVIEIYEQILQEMPESKYNTEAAYRLGRIYFDIAIDARLAKEYFALAREYFDIVASREGDPLQYYGLFQRGWTNFASAQFFAAIEDFSAILNILEVEDQIYKRTFFEADAIENIAFSLIEYDGTDFVNYSQAAVLAQEILHTYVSAEYGQRILLEAVDLKKLYNAPMQAVDLYQSYLQLYPDSKISPLVVDSIIVLYRQYPKRVRGNRSAEELIIEQLQFLISNYNSNSAWYHKNKSEDIKAELAVIRYAFAFLEPRYFNQFLRTREYGAYKRYEDLVVNFCAFQEFDDEQSRQRKERLQKNIVDLSQDLAETTSKPDHYFNTINEISSYIDKQPDSAGLYHYYELRFYNYEKLYELLQPVVEINPYVSEDEQIELDRAGLDSLLIAAATEYENFLLKYELNNKILSEQLIKVTFLRGELFYENNQYTLAYQDYLKLLNYPLNDDLKMIVCSRLGEISQINQDYEEAEFYFREAEKYAQTDSQYDFSNNILASLLSRARAYEAASDFRSAAKQYLKIAAEYERSKPQEKTSFILKAIENYRKAAEYQTAIDLYLDIAAEKNTSGEILSAYLGAWSIADSLHNWQQSIALRRKFIKLYPNSNEAYKLRLQIIGFYDSEKLNNKRHAAQLLEELHADAGKMDTGVENPAQLLLHAIKLYQELNDEDKVLELSLQFTRLYPDHPRSNDLLIAVARFYRERGDDDNYEKTAAQLYANDPEIDLLVEVAVNKLKAIKESSDELFEKKEYNKVLTEISKFEQEESSYIKQGLQLPTDHIHETFSYYKNHIDFYRRLAEAQKALQVEILEKTPQELIKVNNLTRWKDHLAEGESRIPRLMQACDSHRDKFLALIKEGNQYDLPVPRRTESLFLAAEAYDYSADVVIQQVEKYLDVSNQLNNQEMNANPIQQKQYKFALKNSSLQSANDFRKKAVQLYQTLLKTFSDDKDYQDRWTVASLERLIELGVRERAEVGTNKTAPVSSNNTLLTDRTWQAAEAEVRYDPARTKLSLQEFCDILNWQQVGKANFQYFKKQMYGLEESQAEEIWFTELDTINVDIIYFRKSFELPANLIETELKVFGQHMVTVWVNGDRLLDAAGIVYDSKLKKVLVQNITVDNLIAGANEIIIEVIGTDYYKGLIAEMTYKVEEKE